MNAVKNLTSDPFAELEGSEESIDLLENFREDENPAENAASVKEPKKAVKEEPLVWTSIPRGNDEALKKYALSVGLGEKEFEQVRSVLDGESITSKEILLLDVTEGLRDYINDGTPMLVGHVERAVAEDSSRNANRSPRGFTFTENEQHVLLAKFTMRTTLEEPDKNGLSFGKRDVIFTIFPNTTPGIKGTNGRVKLGANGQPASYRPGFRLMITHYFDDQKIPLWARFPMQPRCIRPDGTPKAEFGTQLPQYLYGAALDLGATKEDLCVSEESRQEQNDQRRLRAIISGPSAGQAPRRQNTQVSEFS